MHVIVQDPYMLFRIVWIDRNKVGALQNLVPLRPSFDEVTIGVRDDDAVLPFRVDAKRPIPPGGGISAIRPRSASARQRRNRRIAPGQPANWKLNARTELG